MKYGYYPGCSLHSIAAEYEHSTQKVCNKLGIELEELKDWNCCGASSAHSTNHLAGIAIPARNLAIAKDSGLDKVFAPCAACFQRFAAANHEINQSNKMKEQVEKAMNRSYDGSVEATSMIDLLNEAGIDKIAQAVQKPLVGLKVACYYGCYLVKPQKISNCDDPENPMSMDKVMQALGAETIQWPYKTECCGASLAFVEVDIVLKASKDIIQHAKEAGADCIVTCCPLCQPNLDMRQGQINKKYGTNYDIPIFYVTELMALAFGHNKGNLELNKHFVDPMRLLANY